MAKLKDEFTSAEHYLLALTGEKRAAAKLLKDLGSNARQADAGAAAGARLAARDGSESGRKISERWKNTDAI